MVKKLFIFSALALLVSCSSLSVFHQSCVESSYVSARLDTPDPRREQKGCSELLLIEWSVPTSILEQKPELKITAIYGNFTQSIEKATLTQSSGSYSYILSAALLKEKKGLLTYQVEILLQEGTCYKSWQHPLYFELMRSN